MSRIGRKPIAIPAGVEVKVDGNVVSVKGKVGEASYTVNPGMTVAIENNEIVVTRADESKEQKSLHGLTRTLIANMVQY